MSCDSNASALDGGLDAAIVFVDVAPAGFMKQYTDKLVGNVVEKALGARPSTQAKGKVLVLKLMEIDDPIAATSFLLTKLADKKPKVPPLCLEIVKEGVIAYGARPFPIKEIIASLSSVFNGTNGPAREMAMTLALEISKLVA